MGLVSRDCLPLRNRERGQHRPALNANYRKLTVWKKTPNYFRLADDPTESCGVLMTGVYTRAIRLLIENLHSIRRASAGCPKARGS